MAAYQAPPSLGFSRQEHWSELPFPSPMHESEKWKWSRPCLTISDPTDCSLPGSSVHGIFQEDYWSGVPLPTPTSSLHFFPLITYQWQTQLEVREWGVNWYILPIWGSWGYNRAGWRAVGSSSEGQAKASGTGQVKAQGILGGRVMMGRGRI